MRLETNERVIMMYVYTLNGCTHRNLIRICCCLFNKNVDDEVILLISDRKNNISQSVTKKIVFTFIYVEIEETQREIDVCLNRKYCVK